MLDWLTTIPGILIVCGVVLLIIAIILFLVGTKKDKKEAKKNLSTDDMNIMTSSVSEVPSEQMNSVNVSEIDNSSIEQPIAGLETVSQPEVSTVSVENEIPVTNDTNVSMSQVEEPIQVIMPTMETSNEIPEVSPSQVENSGFEWKQPEEKPVTIYGGNDPLEATQTFPKVEEHHEPYGGVYPEVKIVEPVSEPVMPEAVSTTTTPVSEPIVINEDVSEPVPEVVNIPSFDEVSIEEEQTKPVIEEL